MNEWKYTVDRFVFGASFEFSEDTATATLLLEWKHQTNLAVNKRREQRKTWFCFSVRSFFRVTCCGVVRVRDKQPRGRDAINPVPVQHKQ